MLQTSDYLDCPCTMFTETDKFKLKEDDDWKGVVEETCLWPRLHGELEMLWAAGVEEKRNACQVNKQ